MLTLWQNKAITFEADVDAVLIVKTGKVVEFRGNKKLSIGQNSHLKVDDLTINEVKR